MAHGPHRTVCHVSWLLGSLLGSFLGSWFLGSLLWLLSLLGSRLLCRLDLLGLLGLWLLSLLDLLRLLSLANLVRSSSLPEALAILRAPLATPCLRGKLHTTHTTHYTVHSNPQGHSEAILQLVRQK